MVLEGPNNFTASVLRRNSEGQYERVYSRNEYALLDMTTNGRWFSVVDPTNNIAEIFKLDINGNAVDSATIEGLPDDSHGLITKILSDDSFLAITPSKVYTFQARDNGWQIVNESPLTFTTLTISNDSPSIYISDNFIVGIDPMNSSIYFYERQTSDSSWNLRPDLTMVYESETYDPYNVAWNGKEALFLSNYKANETLGALWIFVKSASGWSLTNTISGSEHQYFGYSINVLDEKTILVSSPFDGSFNSSTKLTGGSAIVVTKSDSGEWQTATNIRADNNDILFGMTVVQNDDDLLFYSCSGQDFPNYICALYSYPICQATTCNAPIIQNGLISSSNIATIPTLLLLILSVFYYGGCMYIG